MTPSPTTNTSRARVRRRPRLAMATASLSLLAVVGAPAAMSPAVAVAGGFPPTTGAHGPSVAAAADGEPWIWPVPAPIRVVDPFRAPPTPYAAGHRGIDLDTVPGAILVAPASGVVSFAGQVAGRPVVAIDHGGGVVSAIEPVAASVAQGAAVDAGDAIGSMAAGGHCATRCAHFGVRIDGEYVSPFLFLGGLPRAVLLPAG